METKISAHKLPPGQVPQNTNEDGPHSPTSRPNYLSLAPKLPVKGDDCFDHDGPGDLSPAGPRHDNDPVNVSSIRIFPTTDEILSRRPPFMPYKNINRPHFLERGPERLIDTLFRQLRHNSVEFLKDCIYSAAQKLVDSPITSSNYDPHEETLSGNRYYLYRGAQFEELMFEDRKGLTIQISYACPRSLRGRRIFNSGRFEKGMVVALVGLDDDEVSLSATFFEVHVCQSTHSMEPNGGNRKRAAVQLLFAEKDSEEDVRRIVNYSQGLSTGRFVLVEFPKCLLNGFYPVLKRIQTLGAKDLAMTRLYAPRSVEEENIGILAPTYAMRDSAHLDLSGFRKGGGNAPSYTNQPLRDFIADKAKFLKLVKQESTLNDAQAAAFVETMSSEFAFVQGPPGTGKTFLGVALTQAILAARGLGKKPVLAVCTTNHALDSFLGDLVKQGFTSIARFGGGSKQAWTKKYSLKALTSKMKITDSESEARAQGYSSTKYHAIRGGQICESINSPNKLGWYIVSQHLQDNYQSVYNQLAVAARTGDHLHGSELSGKAVGFPYAFWSAGGDLDFFNTSLQTEFISFLGPNNPKGGDPTVNEEIIASVLRDVTAQTWANSENVENNIWLLSLSERQDMIARWAQEIDPQQTANKIVEIHLEHYEALLQLQAARRMIDLRCLAGKQIIGSTTTACATNWDLLKSLDLEVVICEEAGEVIEAHTICTLFKSVEHAIFIGDPLQLRPQVNEQALSLETKVGSQYRLDESMFERLMDSESGNPALPFSQLSMQKRMHPEISELMKKTLYPYLTDHPSTLLHPSVAGLSHRMYWLDHRVPEDQSVASVGSSKSFSNAYEADMVGGLVRYLVNGNAYGLRDIVVLTPYNGQLAELAVKLHSTCKLWINEKDRETLLEQGFLNLDSVGKPGPVEIDMHDMLRISTIDNFQGEEAKVVILTTVRSNPDRRPGFLKTNNRINVACSRARDGFYIVGNALSLEVVPMWSDIIDVFRGRNCLGPSLRIMPCSRNPNHCSGPFDVSRPSDFDKIPLCEVVCGEILECGHLCKEICHPPGFHGSRDMKCKEPCNRTHPKCSHPCDKTCGEPCGTCEADMGSMTLDCGHVGIVTCVNDNWGATLRCEIVVQQLDLDCGHKFDVKCYLKGRKATCVEKCARIHSCGHQCEGKCAGCSETKEHPSCSANCSKILDCAHNCDAKCHDGQPCPPCQQPCQRSCSHGRCPGKCSDRCEPCTKILTRGCEHKGTSSNLCGLPSGIPTCDEQQDFKLPCGHIFPGICGEKAPHACVECEFGFPPTSVMVGLSCGHNIDVNELDRHVKFSKVQTVNGEAATAPVFVNKLAKYNLTCPVCRKGMEGVARYEILKDIQRLPDNIDRLIAKIGRKIAMFGKRISHHESLLRENFILFRRAIRPNPLAASDNQKEVQERGKGLTELQEHIIATKEELVLPIEDNLRRLQDHFNNDLIMQKYTFQFGVRFDLLFYRCRRAFLSELLNMSEFLVTLKDPSYQTRVLAESLCRAVIKLGRENTQLLKETIAASEDKMLPCAETELRLLQLSFHCLVLRANKMDCLRGKAIAETPKIHDAVSGAGMPFNDNIPGRLSDDVNTKESIARIFDLIRRFPRSAGRYAEQARSAKEALQDGLKPGPIFTGEARSKERAWGECKVGGVSRCENGHPYPATLLQDCPECGFEKIIKPEPDYEQFLREEEFLICMRGGKKEATIGEA